MAKTGLVRCMYRIAVIGEGGGMRNAVTAGFVVGCGLQPEDVHAYYGASSAIGNGLYFAAQQTDRALEMWVNQLTAPEVVDFKNPLRGKYLTDMDYLVDTICATLDLQALKNTHIDIVASVVRKSDGEPMYFHLTPDNYTEIFKATCAVPFAARPIHIGGHEFVDGGVADNLPLGKAYDDGYRNFIVLNSIPERQGYHIDVAKSVINKFTERGLARGLKQAVVNYERAWDMLRTPMSGVRVFQFVPPEDATISMFERSPTIVKMAYERGLALGIERRQELEYFISNTMST